MRIRTRLKGDSFNSTPPEVDFERRGDEGLDITFNTYGANGAYKPRTLTIDADELERIMAMLFPEKQ